MFGIGRNQNVKPTVNELAKAAGVSLATVDRVLNNRPGVRAATAQKVNDAIKRIGFTRDQGAANLARGRVYRICVILPDSDNEFIAELEAALARQLPMFERDRTEITIQKLPAFEDAPLVRFLDGLDRSQIDGVAIFGPDTAKTHRAIEGLIDRGVQVVSLVSDIAEGELVQSIGIDNHAAGRTAGRLMGRFLGGRGKVLVITGSPLATDHILRLEGFLDILAQDFRRIQCLPILEGQDDPKRVAKMLPSVFEAHPDISAIYSAAGGNEGLVAFLSGLYELPVVIAHELTPTTRKALRNGLFAATINQDAGHLVRSAIRVLRAKSDGVAIDPWQEAIRIDVTMVENLPQTEEEFHVSRT